MDGNYNKQYFIHSSNEESSIDLHDSRISQIQLADDSISFYFPDGVYLTSNGEKTKETIVKLIIEPENINVYVSKEHRSLLKRREKYIDYIKENALAYGIGIVSAEEIDEINIYEASRKAMLIALSEVRKKIEVDYVITDAMPIDIDIESMPIIKGDAKSITIAAASVIAKVTRDRMMIELDSKYPEYGFKKHKGYPTKAHIEAINKYGLIDGYRKTYGPVKELIEKENKHE